MSETPEPGDRPDGAQAGSDQVTGPEAGTGVRFSGPELAALLALRPGPSATTSAEGLGIDAEADIELLSQRGLWQQRHGMGLPAGEAITVGDVLTSAFRWLRIGSQEATAAVVVVGPDRTLLAAPLGSGEFEFAALDARAPLPQTVAGIVEYLAGRTDEALHVHAGELGADTLREQILPAQGVVPLAQRLTEWVEA